MKIILLWTRNIQTHTILREDGIGCRECKGYEKISLEEILSIAEENGGELKFMFARQIAPSNIETILSLLYIKKTIDEYSDKVGEVNLDILQWGDDKFSRKNIEKGIFVEPQTLDGKKYYIAAQSKSQLDKNIKIRDVYLDVDKISEMIKETELEYMKEPLDYLIQKGKVTKIKVNTDKGKLIEKDSVNILDFWGLATLSYIGEVSKHIFGIDDYQIKEFKDRIKLVNGDVFDISGYESTFKYKDKKLRFRIYDASHIYKEESKKYKTETNPYITLTLLSRSGYILLDEDPTKEDKKTRHFYKEAKNKTGYNILPLELDVKKLIKRRIIGEEDYVKFIGKDKIPYIINTIRYIYGI